MQLAQCTIKSIKERVRNEDAQRAPTRTVAGIYVIQGRGEAKAV